MNKRVNLFYHWYWALTSSVNKEFGLMQLYLVNEYLGIARYKIVAQVYVNLRLKNHFRLSCIKTVIKSFIKNNSIWKFKTTFIPDILHIPINFLVLFFRIFRPPKPLIEEIPSSLSYALPCARHVQDLYLRSIWSGPK